MLDISNYYEQLVIDQLWKILEDADAPLSRNVLEDVACLALNKLSPCYVRNTVDMSSHLSEVNYDEMRTAVAVAIVEALEQVSRRPHDARDV